MTAQRPRHVLSTAVWVLFAITAMVLTPQRAEAQEGIPFGLPGSLSGTTDTSDRDFIREWEANPTKGYATLSEANIVATKAAIKKYEAMVAAGGWTPLPETPMQAGESGRGVALLRKRLQISGDLRETGYSDDGYDYAVEKAVKRFQASNGLPPTGRVDKYTIAALNIPAKVRLKQLQINLARLTELSQSAAKRYILVNIPAAQIEAIENGRIVSRHAGVVGKVDRATPLLRSEIHEMNFNPVWRLPPTVISKDLIPKGRQMQKEGKNVLVKFGIDAYDGSGKKLDPEKINWNSAVVAGLSYSQQPGKDNPLGFLKINFHNAHSVYMHDTPSETIFGRNFRAASSGCVRVHGIEKLALWLLAGQGWTEDHVTQLKESGARKDVKLKKSVPLYFVYITAWATEDGIVQFRRDLYGRDGLGDSIKTY